MQYVHQFFVKSHFIVHFFNILAHDMELTS